MAEQPEPQQLSRYFSAMGKKGAKARNQRLTTQKNFRALIGRICFAKRHYLARCAVCEQFFIKHRNDQKICLGLKCKRKANSQRQSKHQEHKKKSARKTRGGL